MNLTQLKSLKKIIINWEKEGLISEFQRESLILDTETKIKSVRKLILRAFSTFLFLVVLCIIGRIRMPLIRVPLIGRP